jgi:hypothetical protein
VFELLSQNTVDWAYKQQKCISHSCGSSEVQIKVLTDLGPKEGPLPYGWRSSQSNLHTGEEAVSSLGLSYVTNPIHEGSALTTKSLPQGPTPNTITLGLRVST